MFEKVISINKLCPQSVLKHSVVHFQGIATNFKRFLFKICLSKYRHAISRQLSYHQCLICIFDVTRNTLLFLLFKYIHIQPVNPQICGSFAGNLLDFGFITNKFDPDLKLLQA